MTYIYRREVDIAEVIYVRESVEAWCKENISEEVLCGDFIHENSGRPVEWDLSLGLIHYLREPVYTDEKIYHIDYLMGKEWLVAICHLSYSNGQPILGGYYDHHTCFLMIEFPDEATAVTFRLTCEL